MQPEPRHRLAVSAFALCDLVLMVRKDEIKPAGMDVNRLAEHGLRHCRALDMPARPPLAPRTIPARLCGLARLRSLPKRKVRRVALARIDLDPRARHHVVPGASRQLPVIRHRRHVKQHAILARISMTLVDQRADDLHHSRNVIGRMRTVRRLDHPQRAHVVAIDPLELLRDLRDRPPCVGGRGDDLVVHIRDVGGIDHMVRPVFRPQQAKQHVERDRGPRIANMGVGIDCRPALSVARPAAALSFFPRKEKSPHPPG